MTNNTLKIVPEKKLLLTWAMTFFFSVTLFGQREKILMPAVRSIKQPGVKMIGQDDFNASVLDSTMWLAFEGDKGTEEQYYRNQPSNLVFSNGTLKLTAIRQSYRNHRYTSANIISKKEYHFGYYELRCKIPHGKGLWPAFWFYKGSGTYYQEIDVFEMACSDTKRYYVNNFWKTPTGDKSDNAMIVPKWDGFWFFNRPLDLSKDYYVYGVNWTPNKIEYYFNGNLVHVKTEHIPQLPMPILINLAVGGIYDGSPNEDTKFPASLEIDYFRAFEPLK